jgi:two-component system cell cycle response regulator
MRKKILTVDDSKTVRIIVKKAFKTYDCDIFEAGNGVEGLAVAAKEMPDLILLDITMPVMDGVETLTKLKSDPQLKGIPVMMLTAEGGKENVLKIAKIGVRDYIVKPFKEDLLVEKANRIVDLKPLADGPSKVRSIFDPADILVVDDKPVIVQQIQEGLRHTPWKIHSATSQAEALEFCTKTVPDLILASLALPEDGAFSLFRLVRANNKTKYTPVFALVVKTEALAQQQAQQAGFSFVATKPLDMSDLETRMAKAMNLDTSQRYYSMDGDLLVMRLPENCSPSVLAEVSQYLQIKLAQSVDSGYSKAVFDLHAVKALHMGVIKALMQAMQACRDLTLQFALVANSQIVAECKGFEDTRNWSFYETFEEAKANLGKSSAAAAATATAVA